MKKKICILFSLSLLVLTISAQQPLFTIADNGKVSTIAVDRRDWKGVVRAAGDLADDICKVTGTKAEVAIGKTAKSGSIAGVRTVSFRTSTFQVRRLARLNGKGSGAVSSRYAATRT